MIRNTGRQTTPTSHALSTFISKLYLNWRRFLQVGDIPTLKSIQLEACAKSADDSARRIMDEQEESGNEDLQVIIVPRFGDSDEEDGRVKEKIKFWMKKKIKLIRMKKIILTQIDQISSQLHEVLRVDVDVEGDYIQLREGAQRIIAAAAPSSFSSLMPSVALTPMSQSQQLKKLSAIQSRSLNDDTFHVAGGVANVKF
ncbi:hypothetical protein ACS0TY_000208 [Phlomoides rotata]